VKVHAQENIVLMSEEITTFYGWRPDGVAFDFLMEFTRLMDSVTSSHAGDWAERKELEKNE
jgi:hypothetical protein